MNVVKIGHPIAQTAQLYDLRDAITRLMLSGNCHLVVQQQKSLLILHFQINPGRAPLARNQDMLRNV